MRQPCSIWAHPSYPEAWKLLPGSILEHLWGWPCLFPFSQESQASAVCCSMSGNSCCKYFVQFSVYIEKAMPVAVNPSWADTECLTIILILVLPVDVSVFFCDFNYSLHYLEQQVMCLCCIYHLLWKVYQIFSSFKWDCLFSY